MAWKLKNEDKIWKGETHVLAGRTYTGKTRTPESKPLVFVEEPKRAASSKPKRPRKKPEPKPKGATAWD